jgi:release factor glutamine methyltransferase
VLAIAASRILGARMLAVDVSRRAVLATRLNAALNGADVRPLRGDLFEPVRGQRFDLIVSNPPYVPTPDGRLPHRGLARAWEGGPDGRTFVDRICREARGHLKPGGVMLLVHSSVCGEQATLTQLAKHGLGGEVVFRHRGGLGPVLRSRERWLRERRLLLDDGHEELLVIRAQAPPAARQRAVGSPPPARPEAA